EAFMGAPHCRPAAVRRSPSVARMAHSLVIIGGGNMGAALLKGLIASNWAPAADLAVVEVLEPRRRELAEQFPAIRVTGSVPSCEAALSAVKPADAPAAVSAAVAAGARRLVSIAAGITLATLESAAGDSVAVVRAMPNTPSLVGKGAAAISAGRSASATDMEWARAILGAVGTVVEVPEYQLDAVTGLAGSGPAY